MRFPLLAARTASLYSSPAVGVPSKQGWIYTFDRMSGEPVWPIVERPVERGNVPGEWYSPTQPFVTKPAPYDLQGVSIDDLIDFTPELRAEAVKLVSRYKIGPLFTPPPVSRWEGPRGLIMEIDEGIPGSGILASTTFEYDPRGRLIDGRTRRAAPRHCSAADFHPRW